MDAARAALTAGDVDAAIRLLTKVLSLPDHADTPEAKELLGLARERRGQLAHAKAEYEEYLARYPEGDGATRVRQRLDALLTAQSKLPERPRCRGRGAVRRAPALDSSGPRAPGTATRSRHGDAGSSPRRLLAAHRRHLRAARATRRLGAARTGRGLVSLRLRGDGGGSETRVSVVLPRRRQQIDGPWAGTLGRQPGNTMGVFSRFDGVRVSRRVAEQWRVGALGGLPVEYWQTRAFVETGRYLYGVTLDGEDLFGQIDGQLFAVEQQRRRAARPPRDRRGVPLRGRPAASCRATLDYDVFFRRSTPRCWSATGRSRRRPA